jgi:hypothetical protein
VSESRSRPFQSFWKLYADLPAEVQKLADKQFALFQENPRHPSLGFARKGNVYTVEVGRSYRAVARYSGGFGSARTKPTTQTTKIAIAADGPRKDLVDYRVLMFLPPGRGFSVADEAHEK